MLYHKKHKDNLTLVLDTMTKSDAQRGIIKYNRKQNPTRGGETLTIIKQ